MSDAWKIFETTGKVADYLTFCSCKMCEEAQTDESKSEGVKLEGHQQNTNDSMQQDIYQQKST